MGYAEDLCDVIQNDGRFGYLPLDVFVCSSKLTVFLERFSKQIISRGLICYTSWRQIKVIAYITRKILIHGH